MEVQQMADIITEVNLPSRGLIYTQEVKWQNQLKAPRLKDRGLADSTRKLKLQANILDNTLVESLGISAYDLHTADFIYLNMRQRQLSKGAAPYRVVVRCRKCGKMHKVDVDLDKLEIKTLKEKPSYEFTTITEDKITYTFITPRILDDAVVNAMTFREQYPEVEMDEETLRTQEFLRLVIKEVNGKRKSYAQMTDYISSMYMVDVDALVLLANSTDFGVDFLQTLQCECGNRVEYEVPIG